MDKSAFKNGAIACSVFFVMLFVITTIHNYEQALTSMHATKNLRGNDNTYTEINLGPRVKKDPEDCIVHYSYASQCC